MVLFAETWKGFVVQPVCKQFPTRQDFLNRHVDWKWSYLLKHGKVLLMLVDKQYFSKKSYSIFTIECPKLMFQRPFSVITKDLPDCNFVCLKYQIKSGSLMPYGNYNAEQNAETSWFQRAILKKKTTLNLPLTSVSKLTSLARP